MLQQTRDQGIGAFSYSPLFIFLCIHLIAIPKAACSASLCFERSVFSSEICVHPDHYRRANYYCYSLSKTMLKVKALSLIL